MTETQLAHRMKISLKHVSMIANGHVRISVPIAVKLERVLGVPAIMWLRLDAQYQLDLYYKRHRIRRRDP